VVPAAQPARAAGGFTPRVAAQSAAPAPAAPAMLRQPQTFVAPATLEPAPVEPMPAEEPAGYAPEPQLRQPAARPAAPAPAPVSRFGSIFQRATGLIRRDLPAEPVAQAQPTAPRIEPMAAPTQRAPGRTPPQEEMGLDIPTFLRRQNN
jgi:cell division protein FtsZ